MNRVLSNLEPKRVFAFFEDLAAIPHGSGNEKGVSDYCVDFAKKNNLRYLRDEANNVFIFKDGTKGYESHEPIILQGHLDMVCAPLDGSGIDMSVEPLKLFIDGDYIGAKDTSLGGDDGIAVAMILAVLESNDIPHPPIEALFTTDEEVGMCGAHQADMSLFKGNKMINLDSEEEGVFTVGCAGGVRVHSNKKIAREEYNGIVAEIQISGLTGGHSGAEIHCGRANSNIEMGKLLKKISDIADIRLIELAGGTKDNVITSATVAAIAFDKKDEEKVKNAVAEYKKDFDIKYKGIEDNSKFDIIVMKEDTVFALGASDTSDIIRLLSSSPFGPRSWCRDIPDMVQTSDNLGILALSDDNLEVDWSVRSSVTAEKDALADEIIKLAASCGQDARLVAPYPAWEYREKSPLRDVMVKAYTETTGKDAVVCTIHAGLECGLFSEKMKNLDAVSIGPEMHDIHSPFERLGISSVARTFEYLKEVLKRL